MAVLDPICILHIEIGDSIIVRQAAAGRQQPAPGRCSHTLATVASDGDGESPDQGPSCLLRFMESE